MPHFVKGLAAKPTGGLCGYDERYTISPTIPPSFSCENDTSLYTKEAFIRIVKFVVKAL